MTELKKTMRALHLTDPSNGTLSFSTTTPLPSPSPTYYVVKVHCTAITTSELTWPPVICRPNAIPGYDLSGTVVFAPTAPPDPQTESLHNELLSDYVRVHRFKPGDEVFALTAFERDGSAAEYVHVLPRELGRKPLNMTHEEAACIPLSTLTAAQALFQSTPSRIVKDGVLVLGATGGVGVMVVQLATRWWSHVAATCGARSIDLVKSLGATEVFDYSQGFEALEGRVFDVVVDTVGGDWQDKAWEWVAEGGRLVTVHSPLNEDRQREFAGKVDGKYFIVEPNGLQLNSDAQSVEDGRLRAVVDSVFPLEEGLKAFEKVAEGHVRGKVVLKVAD